MTQEFTGENFHQEVLASTVRVLVDFWAPVCQPCTRLAPIVNELASELDGQVKVGKINAWEEQDLAGRYHISAVPTLLVFHDGKLVNKLVGFHDKAAIIKALTLAEAAASR